MPLTTQTVPVIFSGGLDQKTPDQLTIMGKFHVLDNCVRRKFGKVEKRYGFDELSTQVVGGTTLGTGRALMRFNDELLQINDTNLYSYLPSTDRWTDRNTVSILNTSSTPLIRNSDTQSQPDICSYKGIVACVWKDSRTSQNIKISIFDENTGAAILPDQLVAVSGEHPKVVGINDRFVITYVNGTSLNGSYVSLGDLTTVTAFGSPIDSSVTSGTPHDLIAWDSKYAVIAYRDSTGDTVLSYLTSTGSLGSAVTALPSPANISYGAISAITLERDPNEDYLYVVATKATTTDLWAFRANLLTFDTATVSSIQATNITIAVRDNSAIDVYSEQSDASPHFYKIYKASYSYDGVSLTSTTANAVFKRTVGLASKAFSDGTYSYVTAVYQSSLQSTYFILRSDGYISSRNFAGIAGGLTSSPGLPRVTGSFLTALQVKNRLIATNDTTIRSDNSGLVRLNIDFDNLIYNGAQLGENLHIASGSLLNFDGVSTTEHGFHLFPENITSSQSAGGLPAGDYYYRVVYEWVDGKGQIHRSAPSIQLSATVTGGSDAKVTLTIPTLSLTLKQAPRSDVKIVVYRGLVNSDQVFYRLGSVTNNPATNSLTFEDNNTITGTLLAQQEILYTTGGTLENIAPPSANVVHLHRNRLFLGGLEEKGFIGYSREYVAGEGVSFTDYFKLPVDPASGNVTAFASMDEKLIIFKRDLTYTLVGDGPLDTGAQDDYSKPQLISGDIGCQNPNSIVIIPEGVLFKSDKGMYLLTRNLTFEYIGADVENFNDLTITSAVLLEDTNEARFTTSTGVTLVYNYYFKQWSTFSNYEAVSAISALGSYLHLKEDGTVRRETPGLYLDAGARFSMTIETSWLSFAGIQGYQRVKEWMLLGDYLTDHYTKIKLFYDFEKYASETVYFNVDEGLDLSYYGDDPVYGDTVVYGGEGSSVYQFSSVPRKQKCQSVKLQIQDIDTKTAGGGASFSLVGMTFEVGQKAGLTKQLLGNKTIGS